MAGKLTDIIHRDLPHAYQGFPLGKRLRGCREHDCGGILICRNCHRLPLKAGSMHGRGLVRFSGHAAVSDLVRRRRQVTFNTCKAVSCACRERRGKPVDSQLAGIHKMA